MQVLHDLTREGTSWAFIPMRVYSRHPLTVFCCWFYGVKNLYFDC